MHTKSVPFEFKSQDDSGTFEATVAVFNNVDRGGDRILPGAFQKSLVQWKASGDPIPVIFNHDWASPHAHIGVVTDAEETDKGLWIKGALDVKDNEVAKQVHKLMARRSLKEFSFGYDIPKGGEKRGKDGVNDLTEITLAEVGPTLKGMNPATELHGVKSALGVKDEPRDANTLRKETTRVERELEESQLPEITDSTPEPVRTLKAMAATARKFITQAEPEEIAAMEDILLAIDSLAAKDATARLFVRVVSPAELAGVKSGDLKAVWSTAYVNALPDGAFLHIQSGGSKDAEGKTVPRDLRMFPYKDADGNIDVPHLRNALARIPQSDLSDPVKKELTAKAQQILDQQKKAEVTAEEPDEARAVDPLRKQAEAIALDIASGGLDRLPKPKRHEPVPEPDLMDLGQLKQRSRDLMLQVLSGIEE